MQWCVQARGSPIPVVRHQLRRSHWLRGVHEHLQAELLRAAEYEEKNRKNLEEEERLLAQLEKELGFSETESYTEDISEDELDELEEDFDPDELTEDQKEAIRKQMERDEEIIQKTAC